MMREHEVFVAEFSIQMVTSPHLVIFVLAASPGFKSPQQDIGIFLLNHMFAT
jgi:hypothetical protein